MTFEAVLDALALPRGALVDRRIPKKLLAEERAPAAAGKRKIMDGIEELHWVAALKPSNTGVAAFTDSAREYLELQVLTARVRPAAKTSRLIEMVHRTIPYPIFLICESEGILTISLARKRRSLGGDGKIVMEQLRLARLGAGSPSRAERDFLESLAFSRQPAQDLFVLYEGWARRLAALAVARVTGTFRLPEASGSIDTLWEKLAARERLEREVAGLRAKADKEKQINRRVALNLEIQRLEAELAEMKETLEGMQTR